MARLRSGPREPGSAPRLGWAREQGPETARAAAIGGLRSGSVSLSLHVLLEYGVGVLSIVAPFLFSFDSDAATWSSILLGAGILVLGFVTAAPTGLARNLPIASHVVLDYVLGLFLIVSPFVFGFTGDDAARRPTSSCSAWVTCCSRC